MLLWILDISFLSSNGALMLPLFVCVCVGGMGRRRRGECFPICFWVLLKSDQSSNTSICILPLPTFPRKIQPSILLGCIILLEDTRSSFLDLTQLAQQRSIKWLPSPLNRFTSCTITQSASLSYSAVFYLSGLPRLPSTQE